MQGYAVGEVGFSYEVWLARVHPENRVPAELALRQAHDQRVPYGHQFRAVDSDGSEHRLCVQDRLFSDSQGAPVRMIGVMRDVTGSMPRVSCWSTRPAPLFNLESTVDRSILD
jgi:PAS domain S-box-containing protein